MDIDIRPIGQDRLEEAMRMLATTFGEPLLDEDVQLERPVFEASRNLAAFEGDTMVGSTWAAPFEITAPGGEFVPCAGITSVGVLPTHRRRGIMRSLLRRQLDELHDQRTPLAYLWASEAAIYQRFGYGLGSLTAAFDITRPRSRLLHPVEPTGRFRLVTKPEALKSFPEVYERVRPTRPGMLARDEAWWNIVLRERSHEPGMKAGPLFMVLYETEGPDGYVAYRVEESWGHTGGPEHIIHVEEMISATPDAYGALWRYCFDIDLARRVQGWRRPADEPLLHMLEEPRALGLQLRDGTWIRLVEVGDALAGRRYAVEGRLVLEVRDGFCDWNDGRWELEGGPEGAECRRTGAEPDLVLDAATLASTYLGAAGFPTLARAGRIEERTAETLTRADAMFATDLAPWCPHIF